ncbi:mechanosensitive ion channel family protein [Myxococcus stipitatus]|uniref:mechanosensitive ion channel family protein n=1 Tax=Myxococcus stipitatus TaxID=83455 RepID=UPI00314517B2
MLRSILLPPLLSTAPVEAPAEGASLPVPALDSAWWGLELWQWAGLGVLVAGAWLLGRGLEWLVMRVVDRATALTKSGWDDQLAASARGPLRYLLFVVLVATGLWALKLPPSAKQGVELAARSVGLAALAWFLLRFVKLAARFVEQTVAREEQGGNVGRARGLRTQLAVLRRVTEVAVVLVCASLLLLQFEAVRNVGVSLLASAGIAGLFIGLAAQKSISTLLAGIQLSITQPIRIGDTVIVENEWGWVEEITLTYVVVKVWDLRRLVIPMGHFLEKPFQNWSKVSPDIMGTAELYVDFRTDVPAVRAELQRVLEQESRGLWDGKVHALQVTDLSERTMKLRALVSASDAGKAFELRCIVREKLMAFLREQPHGLPMVRTEASLAESGDAPVTVRAGANVLATMPGE